MNGSPGLLDSLVLATDEVRRCVRFDEDGNEIDCTPLTSAECITALADTHRIGFHVTRVVPGQNAPVAVDTAVQVRNFRFGS